MRIDGASVLRLGGARWRSKLAEGLLVKKEKTALTLDGKAPIATIYVAIQSFRMIDWAWRLRLRAVCGRLPLVASR